MSIKREKIQKRVIDTLTRLGCKLVSELTEETTRTSKVSFIPSCGHGIKKMRATSIINPLKTDSIRLCHDCNLEIKRKLAFLKITLSALENIKNSPRFTGCTLIENPEDAYNRDGHFKIKDLLIRARCGHTIRLDKVYRRDSVFSGLCRDCWLKEKRNGAIKNASIVCKRRNCKILKDVLIGDKRILTILGSCGHEFSMKLNKFVERDCGLCPKCKKRNLSESRVVEACSSVFGSENVCSQYKIHDQPPHQYIDCAIPNARLFIEYNGAQHYEYTEFFFKSKKAFNRQVRCDNKKRKWCLDNGYTLVEIDGRIRKNQLGSLTTERVVNEIEKQTGHSVEYFKKILEDGNGKSKKNNS